MESKSIVSKKPGKETEFDIDYDSESKEFKVTFGYDGKGVDAGVYANIEPKYFVEKLKKAIPGQVDDVIFDTLLSALKMN